MVVVRLGRRRTAFPSLLLVGRRGTPSERRLHNSSNSLRCGVFPSPAQEKGGSRPGEVNAASFRMYPEGVGIFRTNVSPKQYKLMKGNARISLSSVQSCASPIHTNSHSKSVERNPCVSFPPSGERWPKAGKGAAFATEIDSNLVSDSQLARWAAYSSRGTILSRLNHFSYRSHDRDFVYRFFHWSAGSYIGKVSPFHIPAVPFPSQRAVLPRAGLPPPEARYSIHLRISTIKNPEIEAART